MWFAFKLVSLIPLETTIELKYNSITELWFAFKLVSLIPLETTQIEVDEEQFSCDLLSN